MARGDASRRPVLAILALVGDFLFVKFIVTRVSRVPYRAVP